MRGAGKRGTWGGPEGGRKAHFAEVNGLDAFAAEGGADGRRGRGLSGADDELDYLFARGQLAGHAVGRVNVLALSRP